MGLWVRRPAMLPDEVIEWRAACNWSQGKNGRGGYLWLTSHALVFEPNRVDAATGGQSRRVALTDIAGVGVEAGGSPSFSGGLRRRIRLELHDGRQELVLMNAIETRLREIERAAREVN
jgi:hypothetical protein